MTRPMISLPKFVTIAASALTIAAAYFLSTSDLDFSDKTRGFSAVIAIYLSVCVLIYFSGRRSNARVASHAVDEEVVERTLSELDEASGYFTGSLRSDDALRLVSSKVREVVPVQTTVLFLLNESRSKLIAVNADGKRAEHQKGHQLGLNEGLAGQAFTTRRVETDNYMLLDDEQEFGSSVAIPLLNGENVFAVLQLFFDDSFEMHPGQIEIFESIGSRVAPLMLGAIAHERTQANALTDATTDLPNERAFYLVLENQVAEALSDRGHQPLTILALDIKGFNEINCNFGHTAGNRTLNFAARVLKDNLRQMDFLARALNDEFLVILPGADKTIVEEVIGRIESSFNSRRLAINDSQAVGVELNIGWAVFGADGDTPGQLLGMAQLRKEQTKSIDPGNILWFPREGDEAVH